MDHRIIAAVMLAQFMNLGMAVVAAGDTIICAGGFDLLILEHTVLKALFLETGLQEPAAAATTVVVGAVGLHVDEILFANDGFHHKTQIFGNGVSKTFSDDLTGILDGELNFQILVPIRVDFEFTFTNPFSVVFIDVLDFEIVFEVEFFQSGPD
jgi:threonine dehydrogenase-like Zn-dependent dehydrogenase